VLHSATFTIRGARAEAEEGRPDRLAQAFFGRGFRARMEGQVSYSLLNYYSSEMNPFLFNFVIVIDYFGLDL